MWDRWLVMKTRPLWTGSWTRSLTLRPNQDLTTICHLYGTAIWRFRDSHTSEFHTLYNRCVRRLLNLPYRTHTRLLPLLTDRANSQEQIHGRFVKMITMMANSDNEIIKFLATFFMSRRNSIIGSNLSFIVCRYGNYNFEKFDFKRAYLLHVSDNDKYTAQAIRDMRANKIDFWDNQSKEAFLTQLCIE